LADAPFELWLAVRTRRTVTALVDATVGELRKLAVFVRLAGLLVYRGVQLLLLHHAPDAFTPSTPIADMHMAVVPVSKVDYSVTKGGLRLWAVVFLFIVLCSSLYSVFHNSELAIGERCVAAAMSVRAQKSTMISTTKQMPMMMTTLSATTNATDMRTTTNGTLSLKVQRC
jgi:hypothetical protein